MTNIHDYFGSDFVKSINVKRWKDPRCRIVEIGEANFPNDDRSKPAVSLEDKDGNSRGELALNKTNAMILADAYGDDMDKWLNQWVRLTVQKVNFGGDIVDGIRVETPKSVEEDENAAIEDNDKNAAKDDLDDDIPF